MVETRGPVTLGVTAAMISVASVFVFFRFVSRGWLVKRIGLDDWFILLAWSIAFGFCFAICYGTRLGLGLHGDDVRRDRQVPLRRAEYAISVLYNPALMATKTSIVCFYLSFSKEEQIFRLCNYLTVFVVNAAGLALTFLNIFQCRPVSDTFMYPVPKNTSCTDILSLYLSSAPVNIITDLALLVLPMPILTGMRLPRKQKIILIITFSFGIFVAAVDVIRVAALSQATSARAKAVDTGDGKTSTRVLEQQEYPWYVSTSFMWCAVEINVGIICACVPALKPLFARFLPNFIKSTGDSKTEKYGSMAESVENPTVETEITNPAAARTKTAPSPVAADGEMGSMEFLSDSDGRSTVSRIGTAATAGTARTRRGSLGAFDFVNIRKPKNMLMVSNTESFMPIALVTILFFLWGFAYGLLDTLNAQFRVVVNMSKGEAVGLHAAYYGGYAVGPLTLGHWILKKHGFRATMMAGLVVYSIGVLVFWPSAVLTSYPAFIISNFIVGYGLSCLEVSSNCFIALCGPMEYAEVRLNFSQGFQAIGTVVSPLLAQKVLFRNVRDASSLVDVQWTYLGIALFDVLLALLFYYLPIPEATDEDFDELADRRRAVNSARIGNVPVVWATLALGVFSQFCYVGGQECVGGNTQALMQAVYPNGAGLSPFDYETVGHTIFAVGRFVFAFLNYLLKPRWILLSLYIGLIVTAALNMKLEGPPAAAMLILTYLFESGVFSIIYAISLRGMGVHTKTAAALITAAISGGAPFPAIQSAITDTHSIRYSWSVIVAVSAGGILFPLYLNIVPQARKQVDPVHKTRLARRQQRKDTMRSASDGSAESKSKAFGLVGIVARRKKHHLDSPTAEHFERKDTVGPSTPNKPDPDSRVENEKLVRMPSTGQGQMHDLAPWPDTSSKPGSGGQQHDLAHWPG